MQIILVRNAEHIGEEKHFWAGKEVGLTQKGEKQAKLLCKRLEKEKIDAIYSSDFMRAIKTIQPLAEELKLDIAQNPDFRPFNMGKFMGWTEQATIEVLGEKTWQEIITNPNPKKRYFEGGETLEEEAERAWRGLETILTQHSKATIVISTHLTIIGSLLCRMIEIPLTKVWFWGGSIVADHPAITNIVFQQGRWHLQHYGCTEHTL